MSTRKDIIKMSVKELKRVVVINKVAEKLIRQEEAAVLLDLSSRQVRRIVVRVEDEGERGIIHRLRGQPSNRKKPEGFKKKILELCEGRYSGFNPTFASEKLLEEKNLAIHPETLRLWFIDSEIEYKRRKGRSHRQWRERKSYFGEMVQLDGSHHDWFEGRGSKNVLMGLIDDATGISLGRLYKYEGTWPVFAVLKCYIKKYGIPHSIYVDRHATYKSTKKPTIIDELLNKRAMSQFERAMEELGIKVIHAHSPQAKGRIERSFNTHQDRLVKEMRLKGISDIGSGNKFLSSYYFPKHNRKFAVEAKYKVDLHRPLPKGMDLDSILCIKEPACLRNDFTVAYDKKFYQVLEHVHAKKVVIEKRINSKIFITYNGRKLKFKRISKQSVKQKISQESTLNSKGIRPPAATHPWRNPNRASYKAGTLRTL